MISVLSLRTVLASSLLACSSFAQVNWSQAAATGAPMALGGSAFDTARNRLVAFGGDVGGIPGDFTREFNPATNQWLSPTPAPKPSVRRRAAMAYDAARGECVLFGGGGTGINLFLADTWTWNGTTWTLKSTPSAPSPRFGAAMAYDSVRQVVVMFGGYVPSGLDTGDVWEWDGAAWTQRTFPAPSPLARGSHRMVFDVARAQTVLYGGFTTPGQTTLADTWLWDGTAWTQGASGPGSLCDQLFVYDDHRQRTVLFGGLRITGAVFVDLALTWEWNGTAWTQRSPTSSPAGRSAMACGFSSTAPSRVLSGGGTTSTGTQFGTTFALQPTTPATVSSFGIGCPSTAGPVSLNPVSMPYVGSDFVHEIGGASPSTFVGLIAFGLSNTLWSGLALPLDLTVIGAPGCSVLVSVDVAVVTILNNGAGTVSWSLPNQPSLIGQSFFTQGILLDPQSPLAFQIGASSGRQFTIGSP